MAPTKPLTGRASKEAKPWAPDSAYRYVKRDDGHWRVEPAEAAIVERIFAEHVQRGRSVLSHRATAQPREGADASRLTLDRDRDQAADGPR